MVFGFVFRVLRGCGIRVECEEGVFGGREEFVEVDRKGAVDRYLLW